MLDASCWGWVGLTISTFAFFAAIRKLTEKRRRVEGSLERRDVTRDYADSGSQAFAPLTRIGVFLDRNSEQYVVRSRYVNSYQGIFSEEYKHDSTAPKTHIHGP